MELTDIREGLDDLLIGIRKDKALRIVEKAIDLGEVSGDLLVKAKYIRRIGTKGNYKYIYDEGSGRNGGKKVVVKKEKNNKVVGKERKFKQVIPKELKKRNEELKKEGYTLEAHSTTMDGMIDDLYKERNEFEGTLSVSTMGSPIYVDKGNRGIYVAVSGKPKKYFSGDVGREGLSVKNTPYDEIYLEEVELESIIIPKSVEKDSKEYMRVLANSVVAETIYEDTHNVIYGGIVSESGKNLDKDISKVNGALDDYYEKYPEKEDDFNDLANSGLPKEFFDILSKK